MEEIICPLCGVSYSTHDKEQAKRIRSVLKKKEEEFIKERTDDEASEAEKEV